MRRNHIKRNDKKVDLNQFDRIYIDAPEYPNVTRFVCMPLKTIYINIAAWPEANVVMLIPYESILPRA